MNEINAKKLIVETGKKLIEYGLVARTWGNVSCRVDDDTFVISPSGLGYDRMTVEDVPLVNRHTGDYTGPKMPSIEKLVHQLAYNCFEDVGFVVHTHQECATMLGLTGDELLKSLEMTAEERELIGPVAISEFGLAGSEDLSQKVEEAYKTGARVVIMKHHGAIFCASNQDEAISKALAFEKICKRAVEEKIGKLVYNTCEFDACKNPSSDSSRIFNELSKKYSNLRFFTSPQALALAKKIDYLDAQLDDMAQILGDKLIIVDNDFKKITELLETNDALLVREVGCFIKSNNAGEALAIELLLNKAIDTKLFTLECGVEIAHNKADCKVMREFYVEKYSKRK